MRFYWSKRRKYFSTRMVESRVVPGVRFCIAKMSFGRRIELMARVRDAARRVEFLAASREAAEQMDARLLQAEIERLYVTWGIRAVSGLVVDGRPATPELLAESGPEELFREALALVQGETGLTDEERKN